MSMRKLFLTFFGTGLSPVYPRLIAMLVALVSGVAILYTMGMETLFMLALAVSLIGIFEINQYQRAQNIEAFNDYKDEDGTIVIDKAAGIWFSLLIPYTTALSLSYPYALELSVVFSFASFWFFDHRKPSTIGWIARNVIGGLGVMGSAILSGFAGGFLTIILLMGIGKL
ncbi:MAG TPA: phosphatidylglycerophosphatase A, partial [Epsilonproteobacteria bacterium]|nr:phosphatidylglycerophosphatase A [Campylobacterota bacterium]